MSSLIAAIATRVAYTADAVARSVAPIDPDGADAREQRAADGRPLARAADVLQKTAQDIHDLAVRGPAFSISDLPAYADAIKNVSGAGINDRKMLLEKLLVLMSRLPDDSQFASQLQVLVIDILYKDLPHPPAGYLPLPPGASAYPSTNATVYSTSNGHANGSAQSHAHDAHQPYAHPSTSGSAQGYNRRPYAARSADGTGYSSVTPDMGAAHRPYARTVPPIHPYPSSRWPDAGLLFDALLARRPSDSRAGVRPSSDVNATPGHTTLPPTDAQGFAPQPGGLSSLFFAFADLVIHSVFNTSHAQWGVNDVSSYLDLSPLYGSSEADNKKVRRGDGTGRLWEDVWADGRVLFMPPSVPALLVLFGRNHNYIATKLLEINEAGSLVSGADLDALSDVDKKAQDDELFARARLVNCGWFMRVILGDYVGAILGLVRDGLDWRLDPLAESRELDHSVSPRGEGNVVSLEFNLLYRWHAALSERDTAWTEKAFTEYFGTTDFKSITVDQFQSTLATKLRPDKDVRKWTIDGVDNKPLARDPSSGAFKSADIAALLQAATAAPAGAFKARGIPEVLRVVEIMGIEQSRQWGTCTMNEFRKFMGLKQFDTFEEWNSDPEINRTAEMLYGHIDNLELHVGLQAEEAKPPIPGAGLCPGYTISRAILADAVALVRGDRFLTTDFTVYNLTSWGYQDCFPEKNDGAYGGVLTRLLYRTLPEYYPARSSYARFPFMVPELMQGYLENQGESPVKKYEFGKPARPLKMVVVTGYKSVKEVLAKKELFRSTAEEKLAALSGGAKPDIRPVNETLKFFSSQGRYTSLFSHITHKLIEEKSVVYPGSPKKLKYVDIVRDVANLVPVYFVAAELMGLPLKTEQTPHGLYRDTELAEMFADVGNYVFVNTDPYLDWVLREKSAKTAQEITEIIKTHLKKISGRNIISKVSDSLTQWYTGEDNFSDAFLSKVVQNSPRADALLGLANDIFGAIASTTALYSKAIVHIVDFFLSEEKTAARKEVIRLANEGSFESDDGLYSFACEALRLNPPLSSVIRTCKHETTLDRELVMPGQPVYCSIAEANVDCSIFGENSISLNSDHPEEGILGLDHYGLTNSEFFKATVPRILRVIFKLKNLQRAPGNTGTLSRVVETENNCPEVNYLNNKGSITPFPISMVVQYDA